MFPTLITALTFQALVRLTTTPVLPKRQHLIAVEELNLEDRQPDPWVNSVFKYNIIQTMNKMGSDFTLEPGQSFAFHEDVLDKYSGKVVKTTNAHFDYSDGYKSDGYLMGDGVCHLASFMNKVARDAELGVEAPTNHNFATIPDVDRKYGTAIYFMPGNRLANAQENLYITNNLDKPVEFKFDRSDKSIKLSIYEKD